MQIQTWKFFQEGTTGSVFHFGRHGLGQEETGIHMPSDSLFAALVVTLARSSTPDAVDAFCQRFLQQPPFVLSSCFPFAGGVRFFPVPQLIMQQNSTLDTDRKKLKKIRYVSEALFRIIIQKGNLDLAFENDKPCNTQVCRLQNGEVLISRAETAALPAEFQAGLKQGKNVNLWREDQRPRVSIDRETNQSNIYIVKMVHYAVECGLWFGIRWLDDDSHLRAEFSNLVQQLAAAGLGAERSSGVGVCSAAEWESVDLPDGRNQPWVSLSRYLPVKEEVPAAVINGTTYRLEGVGGWVNSPAGLGQRRRRVNLLLEGSIFGPLDVDAPGRMVDVRPRYSADPADPGPLGHPVYRNGFALAVGIKGDQS